jgi:hypothetical protein
LGYKANGLVLTNSQNLALCRFVYAYQARARQPMSTENPSLVLIDVNPRVIALSILDQGSERPIFFYRMGAGC